MPPPGKDQLADPSRGQEGKRRDRRRRRLAKQRAETAAAAAAAAGAALALLSGSEVAGQQQEQQEGTEQQAQKRRRPRRKRHAQDSSGSSDGGTQLPARERQIPISPKEEDLLRRGSSSSNHACLYMSRLRELSRTHARGSFYMNACHRRRTVPPISATFELLLQVVCRRVGGGRAGPQGGLHRRCPRPAAARGRQCAPASRHACSVASGADPGKAWCLPGKGCVAASLPGSIHMLLQPASQPASLPRLIAPLLWCSSAYAAQDLKPSVATRPHPGLPPLQSWLDERLDYMGFEGRQFPALQPLDVAWRRQQAAARQKQQPEQQPAAEQGGDGQEEEPVVAAEAASTSGSSSNDDSGSSEGGHGGRGCTTATFARWAQAAGGQLPLLASQWRRGVGGWELGRPGRQLLQEAHAAHEWGGAAEEHARAMIGERQPGLHASALRSGNLPTLTLASSADALATDRA